MIIGTTIFKMDGDAFYGPEIFRGGLAASFLVDVTHFLGTPTVTITIEHRNEDETSWSVLGAMSPINIKGTHDVSVSGVKEIVRMRVDFDAGDAALDAIHLLMMSPSWRPY